ncbi:MAG: S24/S26 family peptidase [Anaeroplasmataceae bacterium]|nr:S24/S26 family peptidase [Anaeroplasmataceae bacterium]MDE6415372.1 S24/S26 family peptidase [Anaeroplasmataceae bacterium]
MIKVEDFYPLILEAFQNGNTFTFPVHGTSMQPLLHTNDLVVLEAISTLKKGDIVFYRRENKQFVLHRIRRVKKDSYTFVGDHQTQEEQGITLEQCIGKVIAYKKQGKEKQYNLRSFKYRMYTFLVRSKLIRGFFGKVL